MVNQREEEGKEGVANQEKRKTPQADRENFFLCFDGLFRSVSICLGLPVAPVVLLASLHGYLPFDHVYLAKHDEEKRKNFRKSPHSEIPKSDDVDKQ